MERIKRVFAIDVNKGLLGRKRQTVKPCGQRKSSTGHRSRCAKVLSTKEDAWPAQKH